MAFTGILAEDDSVPALLDGLRRGAVILSGGPVLDLSLTAAGRTARVGGTLRAGGGAVAELEISRLPEPAELRVFRNGEQVHAEQVGGAGRRVLEGLAVAPGWYRAELWQGPVPRAMTNHVVLEGE
jgi:hypothetical protein